MIGNQEASGSQQLISITADTAEVRIDDSDWLRNAKYTQNGTNLVITGQDGQQTVIENYFLADDPPSLVTPDGKVFSPTLIKAFVIPERPGQYAGPVQGGEPIGVAKEVSGKVTVTRTDGTTATVEKGTLIFQGDIVETDEEGATELVFIDETSFAISSNAKLSIDEYVFDPSNESGSTSISMLRGLFIFTSGLIARNDPDDVHIETPIGSIGIRGTIIAGNVDSGEFTVVEGAIVVRSNSGQEFTLSSVFETVRFNSSTNQIEPAGITNASELVAKFSSMFRIAPAFFTNVEKLASQGQDASAAAEGEAENGQGEASGQARDGAESADTGSQTGSEPATSSEAPPPPAPSTSFDANILTSLSGYGETSTTTTVSDTTATSTFSGSTTFATTSTDSATTSSSSSTDGTAGTTSDSTDSSTTPPPPPPNSTPVVLDAVFTIDENTAAGTFAGLVNANDPDAGQTLSYSITAGNTGGAFTINSSGQIYVSGALNHEILSTYTLTVTVTDNGVGTLSDTATITINIADVNDAPTISNASFGIAEDAALSTAVGTVSASDEDAGQTLTYAIVAGNTGGAFAIDSATGEITVAAGLDRETVSSYSLTVTVTDDGTGALQASATITINIGDVNDNPPSLVAAGPFTIAENSAPGTVVDTVSAVDADTSGILSFSITGGTGVTLFEINSSTGTITVTGGLDYEITDSYTLLIEVSDGVATDQLLYTINITDVNDCTPSIITNAGVSLSEGGSAAITMAKLSSEDADTADTGIVYTITSGPSSGHIELSTAPGVAVTSFTQQDIADGKVTYIHDGSETISDSFTFDLSDGTNTLSSNTFNISVSAIDDAPELVTNTGASGDEGASIPITIASLSANDADTADSLVIFDIVTNPLNGQLELTTAPGFAITSFTQQDLAEGRVVYVHDGSETTSDSFVFQVRDETTTLPSDTFTISISSINDTPVLDLDADNSSGAFDGDFNTTFTEGGGPVNISDADLTLADDDTATIQSATIIITNQFDGALEILTVDTGATPITASYDNSTGVLTLSGVASIADYEAVLKTIRYENLSDNPETTTRIIEVFVNDGQDFSNVAKSYVSIDAVNNAPIANNDAISTGETGIYSGNVLADNGSGADSEPENDTLTVTEVGGSGANVSAWTAGSSGGMFKINPNGTFLFDPGTDFDHLGPGNTATTTITYQISDGNGGTDTATVTMTINGEALNLNSLVADQGFRINALDGTGLGDSLSVTRDMDNDGYCELMFTKAAGNVVYILDGRSSSYTSSSLTSFNGTNGGSNLLSHNAFFSTALGTDTQAPHEIVVSYIGDFDGDGDVDYVVGAYSADSAGAPDSGQIFIMDSLGNKVLELKGISTGDWLGETVTGIGDINNDGFADVLVGAPKTDGGDGAAYILFGHPVASAPATIDVAELGTGIRGISAGTNVGDAFVYGNYIYVIETNTGTNGQIRAYNISDPANPVAAGNAAMDIDMEGGNSIWYDATTQRALATSDLKNEVNLVHFNSPGDCLTAAGWSITDPIDCLIINSRGFVLTAQNKIFVINDISGTPSLSGNAIDLTAINADFTGSLKIDTDGESIYVLTTDEIIKIDPAVDPASPAGSVFLKTTLPAGSNDIAIDKGTNTAYVSNTNNQIRIIDLDSGSLTGILWEAQYPELANVKGLYVKDSGGQQYLYAVSSDGVASGSVLVFDITDTPDHPIYIGSFTTGASGFMGQAFDVVAAAGSNFMPIVLSGTGVFRLVDPFVEGVRIDGDAGSEFGSDSASAGDFNNDGFMDFAVSMPGSGKAHIFLGSKGDPLILPGADSITLMNIQAGTDMPLHYVGDFNGDGVSDMAVHAEAANGGKGAVHVVFGSSMATAGSSINMMTLDGTNGFTITTGLETAHIISAGGAGDFNGDGFDDFVVALKDPGSRDVSLFVLYGGNDSAYGDGEVTYAELHNSSYAYAMKYQIPASVADPDNFDILIHPAGDLNGDGFGDIALGMPDNDNDGDGDADGSVFVIYGRDTQSSQVVLDNVIPPGPAESGHWKFDESTGSTAADSSGGGNTGSLVNFGASPWDNQGVAGRSLAFDGSNDYVQIASGPNISGGSFTISAWVKLAATGMEQTILSHGSAGATSQLVFGFDSGNHLMAGFGGSILAGSGTFSAGKWYNVAVSYDSATNTRILYVDGTEIARDTTANDFEGSGNLVFGKDIFSGADYLNGQIDDIRIYNQTLTPKQMEYIASLETDLNPAVGGLTASANHQSLIGSQGSDIFEDGGMFGVSFRGGTGNDTFRISSASFRDIDGGSNATGRDVIMFMKANDVLDLTAIGSEQISHIEELKAGQNNQTIKLDFGNIFGLLNSSDTGELYITAFDSTTKLLLDSQGTKTADPIVITSEFASLTGSSHQGNVAGYEVFQLGGRELHIDATLFTSNGIEVI